MAREVDESSHNTAYQKGYEDAQQGRFSPPEGDLLTDMVFGPLDMISDTPSTEEVAQATAGSYRAGHQAGSHR